MVAIHDDESLYTQLSLERRGMLKCGLFNLYSGIIPGVYVKKPQYRKAAQLKIESASLFGEFSETAEGFAKWYMISLRRFVSLHSCPLEVSLIFKISLIAHSAYDCSSGTQNLHRCVLFGGKI